MKFKMVRQHFKAHPTSSVSSPRSLLPAPSVKALTSWLGVSGAGKSWLCKYLPELTCCRRTSAPHLILALQGEGGGGI